MRTSEIVRKLRTEKGLTQFALAVAAGVREQTVYRIEGGKSPSLASLEKIAGALEVPVRDLFEQE